MGLAVSVAERAAGQHIVGFDAYDLLSAVLALLAGSLLVARRARRPSGVREAGERRADDALAAMALLALAVLLLHQFVTDLLCHGSCFAPSPGRKAAGS
ncbi:MAG: hypothetical protein NVS3B26_19380 [Mycobacteriales bacterium]